MTNFFKKIRLGLIQKGKTPNYFKYALGEIILVMVGIFFALQANNWNSDRKEARQEQAILQDLKFEYQGKLNELNEKIQLRNLIIHDTNELLEIIANKDKSVPLDSIYLKLFLPIIIPTFDASNSVTDELINSGKLYLVQNRALRKLITDWQPELNKMAEEEQNYRSVSFNSNFPELLNRYPMTHVIEAYYQQEMQADSLVYRTSQKQQAFVKSTKPFDRELFYHDLATENILGMTNFMHRVANRQAMSLKIHINKVLELIASELKRFED